MAVIRRLLESPALFHLLNSILGRLNDVNVRCLTRVLQLEATSRVLDVGCGTGRYATLWGCRYVGLDTDTAYLRFARRQYGDHFVQADAARLPIAGRRFDAAFCVGVLHHCDDAHVGRIVHEMRRATRDGGTIVMLEPLAPEPGDGWIRRRLARLERGAHFRRFRPLTTLLTQHLGSGLQAWREHTRPFDLGLYWVPVTISVDPIAAGSERQPTGVGE
jgi:SAM-dependent methyltransferase